MRAVSWWWCSALYVCRMQEVNEQKKLFTGIVAGTKIRYLVPGVLPGVLPGTGTIDLSIKKYATPVPLPPPPTCRTRF